MKYKPERDIPEAVRDIASGRFPIPDGKVHDPLSPKEIASWALNKRNRELTPESITMYFNRHPDLYDRLTKKIKDGAPTEKQAADPSLFENGAFRETQSVKSWIRDLTNKNAKRESIEGFVRRLKRVCKGEIREGEIIENWAWKHPDRLTLEDAKDFIFEVKKRGYKSREWRLVLRNFLKSKGMVIDQSDISGELETDAGQYADLYVPLEKLHAVLEWLKTRNIEAYKACKFAFKTASRITATLNADAQFLNTDEHTLTVFEKSVMHKDKKQVFKVIPSDLWDELPKQGKMFNISEAEINNLLRQAYKEIIPEIADRIPMPFHFWRHMNAQHVLRLTNWNYGLVGELGNWNPDTLKKYYGKIPHDVVVKVGHEVLPQL
jgi:hypothetical protein